MEFLGNDEVDGGSSSTPAARSLGAASSSPAASPFAGSMNAGSVHIVHARPVPITDNNTDRTNEDDESDESDSSQSTQYGMYKYYAL